MDISPTEFLALQKGFSDKDVENSRLANENVRLKAEIEHLRQRCAELEGICHLEREKSRQLKFIVLSMERVKGFFARLQDFNLIAMLMAFMQKTMPEDATAEDHNSVNELLPMPQRSAMTISAQGDVNVQGNYLNANDHAVVNF